MNESYWTNVLNQRLGRRRALAATGATGAAVLLAACGSSSSSSSGKGADSGGLVAKPSDTTTQAKRGGISKDRAFADPPTLDILTSNNPWGSAGQKVYNSLVLFKPGYLKPTENEVGPDLAESWEYSPDGLQITLKLRSNLKFHNKPPINGRAVDIDDFLFSWNRFATKSTSRVNVVNSANPDAPVLSLTAPDPLTITIKLKEPLVYALALFVGGNGTGPYIIPKETDSTLDLRGEMIGTGPWMMTNYTPSVGFSFKRNPDYYDKDWAYIDQIDMPIISEYAAALAQLKAGNIYQFSQNTSSAVKPEDILPLKQAEPRISVYQGDLGNAGLVGTRLNFGWLPVAKSPFLDERVRQAISMSWDRDLYLDTFLNVSKFRSQGVPVETRWSSAADATYEGWWLDPKSKDFGPNARYFQHDLAEAKKLLAAAGFPNGFETISQYVTGPELGTTPNHAQVIDGFIKELGITSTVRSIDYLKEYVPNYRDGRGQYEGWSYVSTAGAATGSTAIGALASEYWSKGGAAFKGFSLNKQNDQSGDPELDRMIEKARVELDTERRRALVFDIQRYLAKPWYSAVLPGYATGLVLGWPALANYRVWQGGRYASYKWWIDETKAPLGKA